MNPRNQLFLLRRVLTVLYISPAVMSISLCCTKSYSLVLMYCMGLCKGTEACVGKCCWISVL